MNIKLSHIIAKLYDVLYGFWQHKRTNTVLSNLIALVFITGIVTTLLFHFGIITSYGSNKFLGISMAFTFLLIIEVFGLIFVLPSSVSESVGKQFEIISLILLRNSFKDFGNLFYASDWSGKSLTEMLPMMTDAFGAVIVFLITGLFYKAQIHSRITATEQEQNNFVSVKKVIALILLVLFISFGVKDVSGFFFNSHLGNSFSLFYTALVFTDILILIYSLRFSSKYTNVFRYSSYAFATILLRLSLSLPSFYNVLLAILAGLFVLTVAYVYNYLNKKIVVQLINK